MMTTEGSAGSTHWVAAGVGPAVILLHGLGGDSGFWEVEMAALSDTYRVIAIDLRGSGGTPAREGSHTIADLASDVVEVLDALDIDCAHVVGFSMGGLVAQALAGAFPQRVDRLVLASTFARMNAQARLFLDAVHTSYMRSGSAQEMFDLICPWLFSLPFLSDPESAAYLQFDDDTIDHGEAGAWSKLYLAQQAFDFRDRLADIAAPTLVIGGEADALVSTGDLRMLAAEIADASLVIVEDAGHLVNVEQPDLFLEAIRTHLCSTSAWPPE